MKAVGKQCAYPKCKQRIIGGPISVGAEDPEWVIKMAMYGYCMKHGMQEFSNLVPVINPDPDAEYTKFVMIDDELHPLEDGEEE